MVKDSLGNRMKSYYEEIPKIRLMRRTPVALRIDGKAFHTFTKGFKKPFDELLIKISGGSSLKSKICPPKPPPASAA